MVSHTNWARLVDSVLDALVLFRSDGFTYTTFAGVAVEEILPSSSLADPTAFAMELLLLCVEIKENTDLTKVASEQNSALLTVFPWVLNKFAVDTFYFTRKFEFVMFLWVFLLVYFLFIMAELAKEKLSTFLAFQLAVSLIV